jgi:hypothetical protein
MTATSVATNSMETGPMFTKGMTKVGGRTAGTPNKHTGAFREAEQFVRRYRRARSVLAMGERESDRVL